MFLFFLGYGIHIFTGIDVFGRIRNSLSNNDYVFMSYFYTEYALRIYCRSDSTMLNVGVLIGLDGTIIDNTPFFNISNRLLAGELSITSQLRGIPSNDEGVYTCRIPDSTSTTRDVNIGIYNYYGMITFTANSTS